VCGSIEKSPYRNRPDHDRAVRDGIARVVDALGDDEPNLDRLVDFIVATADPGWGPEGDWSPARGFFDLLTPDCKRSFLGGVMADADELVESEEEWPESWK
jgi:hypothetical protein